MRHNRIETLILRYDVEVSSGISRNLFPNCARQHKIKSILPRRFGTYHMDPSRMPEHRFDKIRRHRNLMLAHQKPDECLHGDLIKQVERHRLNILIVNKDIVLLHMEVR